MGDVRSCHSPLLPHHGGLRNSHLQAEQRQGKDQSGEVSLEAWAAKHSLVWEESQKLGGIDPDFHRRDLWDAIEAGAPAEFELGLQVMPDSEDQTFEGIDLLDPTKIVPEEICPVQIVGKMTLDTGQIRSGGSH